MRREKIGRVLALVAIVVGGYRAHQNGVDLTDVKQLIMQVLQGSFARLLYVWAILRGQAQALLKQ
jgi:hypothetical protein